MMGLEIILGLFAIYLIAGIIVMKPWEEVVVCSIAIPLWIRLALVVGWLPLEILFVRGNKR